MGMYLRSNLIFFSLIIFHKNIILHLFLVFMKLSYPKEKKKVLWCLSSHEKVGFGSFFFVLYGSADSYKNEMDPKH